MSPYRLSQISSHNNGTSGEVLSSELECASSRRSWADSLSALALRRQKTLQGKTHSLRFRYADPSGRAIQVLAIFVPIHFEAVPLFANHSEGHHAHPYDREQQE